MIPETEKKAKGTHTKKKLKKKMPLHFFTWWNYLPTNLRNMKKTTPKYIIIKLLKTSNKEKLKKACRKKGYILYIETNAVVTDFSSETMQTRRQVRNIFKALIEKNCQPQILYSAKISLISQKRSKKILFRKTKAESFIISRHTL